MKIFQRFVVTMTGCGVILLMQGVCLAQIDSPQTRLKPLGAPSAVDQYRRTRNVPSNRPSIQQTRWQPTVVGPASTPPKVIQTAFMQSDSDLIAPPRASGGMALPDGVGGPIGGTGQPSIAPQTRSELPETVPFPNANAPVTRSNQLLPTPSVAAVQGSPSDLSPMPQPQIQGPTYARVDNCNLVTGPSYYRAASPYGCGVVPTNYAPVTQSPYSPPAAEIAAPATIPPVTTYPAPAVLGSTTVTGAPARALISFGQERYTVQVGQGLWGQPVAYVPGQGFRNWLRYLSF